jgi:exodeoxyribonuclease VII large subunit
MEYPETRLAEPVILTVSQISRSIRNLLEGEFRFVRVSGEISNLSRPYSGHSYFTLKDENAQLRAVLFKGQQRFLAKDINDGLQVICHGRISVYEPRGDYQLIVDTIDFHGAGLLQLQFEELKKRLAAEGLFDEERKKTIPAFPRIITLITSPSGAAIHDFLKIWRNREWGATIQIFPVRVQGEGAAEEIAGAIARINRRLDTELIVLCRGGGSLEDLWAFNEECVARAIAKSALPIVSAIGHEVDFTIADFCADLRAPTPTGAAEQIIPDKTMLQREIRRYQQQLTTLIMKQLNTCQRQVDQERRLLGDLGMTLSHYTLQVDHAASRMTYAMERFLHEQTYSLEKVNARLQYQSPISKVAIQSERLRHTKEKLTQTIRSLLQQKRTILAAQSALLDTVSPLATLARGYAIARKKSMKQQKELLTSCEQTDIGEQIEVLLANGSLECEITKIISPDRTQGGKEFRGC